MKELMICQVARLMEGFWNLATSAFHSATVGKFESRLVGVVVELVIVLRGYSGGG
jgi:hypothetical protein